MLDSLPLVCSPRKSFLPSEVRKSKPGKSKLDELKDKGNPEETTTETASFLKLSTEEKIAHHIYDRRRDVWLPSKVTPHLLVRVRVDADRDSYSRRNGPCLVSIQNS